MGKVVAYHRNDNPLPHELLLMYRQRSRLTQSQLAAQLGLKSDRMIQKWESGYAVPTASRLQTIIELYWQRRVFVEDKAHEEAYELWRLVKQMFDQNSTHYETYPIFDEGWFEQLTLNQKSKPVSTVLNLSNSASPEKASAPPHSEPKPRNSSLPLPLNRLIGREEEISAIMALLTEQRQPVRLVNLTGPGGSGKTRLAIQVAEELQSHFEYLWYVSLVPVQDHRLVAFTVAKALGLHEKLALSNTELLQQFLANKQALLVLDNFEHVLPATTFVQSLLQSCLNLVVLVTSRVALRVPGEYEFPVAPLKLPPAPPPFSPPKSNLSLAELEIYPAVILFAERGLAVKPSFGLEPANIEAVVEICRRLDGLPLAIELVAAWVKMLPPKKLLSRLVDNQVRVNLRLLTTGGPDVPPRQQTIWASIDWSYSLLSQDEQTLLRRLSIFSGSWELDAAEKICSEEGIEQSDILDLLYRLVNHSLVVVEDSPYQHMDYSEPRFHLLETIKQYSWECLQAADEITRLQQRYLQYFVQVAECYDKGIYESTEKYWIARLLVEIDNFRAALTWGLDENCPPTSLESHRTAALRIVSATHWFWTQYRVAEGRHWMELALEKLPESASNLWRARGLLRLARHLRYQGDDDGFCKYIEESVRLYRTINHPAGLSEALKFYGHVLRMVKKWDDAMLVIQESIALAQSSGIKYLEASAWGEMGLVYFAQGDYEHACYYFEKSIRLWRETGSKAPIATSLINLGRILIKLSDYERARQLFQESFELFRELESHWGWVLLLNALVLLALAEGKHEQAALFLGAAEIAREELDWKLISNEQNEIINEICNHIGEPDFNRLYEQGRRLTVVTFPQFIGE